MQEVCSKLGIDLYICIYLLSNHLPNVVKRITNDLKSEFPVLWLRFESVISIIRNVGTNHYTVKFAYDVSTTVTCRIEENYFRG
jgi:hypothetical protein